MKKVISMLLMIALVFALSVSAFAATEQELADAFAKAKAGMQDDTQRNAADKIYAEVKTNTNRGNIDVKAIAGALKYVKAASDAGTLTTGQVEDAVKALNGALAGTATISISQLKVNGGTITAEVTATSGNVTVALPVTAKAAQGAVATQTAAVTNGVIKATGMNMANAALALAIAVAGVLGFAVVKKRKADACA